VSGASERYDARRSYGRARPGRTDKAGGTGGDWRYNAVEQSF